MHPSFYTGEYVRYNREVEGRDTVLHAPDSPEAQAIGFTPDKFSGRIYINGEDKIITIAYIRSLHRREGNVKQFYRNLIDQGYEVRAVECCDEMENLCTSLGFKYAYDYLHEYNEHKEYYYSS